MITYPTPSPSTYESLYILQYLVKLLGDDITVQTTQKNVYSCILFET